MRGRGTGRGRATRVAEPRNERTDDCPSPPLPFGSARPVIGTAPSPFPSTTPPPVTPGERAAHSVKLTHSVLIRIRFCCDPLLSCRSVPSARSVSPVFWAWNIHTVAAMFDPFEIVILNTAGIAVAGAISLYCASTIASLAF